jgi:hypothetical protein
MRYGKQILCITLLSVLAATSLAAGVAGRRDRASVKRPKPAVSKFGPEAQDKLAAWLAADRERQMTEHRGTDLDVHPALGGLDGRVLQSIRRHFPRDGEAPRARRDYFAQLVPDGYELRGWAGVIESLDRTNAGLLVTIAFNPRLVSNHATTHISDQYIETYEVTEAGIRLVSGGPVKRGPSIIFHD